MKQKKVKEFFKILKKFQNEFNTKNPLKLVVDFNFARLTSIEKKDIVELIKKHYNIDVELYTTSCILNEIRQITILEKTYEIMKYYKLLKCSHKYNPDKGSGECLKRYMAMWSLDKSYSIGVKEADKFHLTTGNEWGVASTSADIKNYANYHIVGIPIFNYCHETIALLPMNKLSIEYLESEKTKQVIPDNKVIPLSKKRKIKDSYTAPQKKKLKSSSNKYDESVFPRNPTNNDPNSIYYGMVAKKHNLTFRYKRIFNILREKNGLHHISDEDFPPYTWFYHPKTY